MSMRTTREQGWRSASVCLIGCFCWLALAADLTAQLTYQVPSQALVDLVDAPRTPSVSVDPTRQTLLLLELPGSPSIEEQAERELRLAGMRLHPRTLSPSPAGRANGLRLVDIESGREREVEGLPVPPRLTQTIWSPDGARFAFTHVGDGELELWVAEVATARARRLVSGLNLVARNSPIWLPDNRTLVVTLGIQGEDTEPPEADVPEGPVVQENLGRTTPARTWQDLLASPHDEALFEHYFTTQIATVDLDGKRTLIGEPGLVWDLEASPSGDYLLVELVHRPFSYRVPVYRFPRRLAVWHLSDGRAGDQAFLLADLPLQEEVPMAFGSVPTGPRSVHWRSDRPATLAWVEALDGGDAKADASERDRLFELATPFTGESLPLATLGLRFAGVFWGNDDLAMVYERWWSTRQQRAWRIAPGRDNESPVLMVERSFEDRYSDPGMPETRRDDSGKKVLFTSPSGDLFLSGAGASPQGDRPFFDRLDAASGESERLFHSEAPYYERPVQLLSLDDRGAARTLLVSRESIREPPNYFVRDLEAGTLRQLTHFEHPTPSLEGIEKELIHYSRADGVELTATLYLPAGYSKAQGPLPAVLWAYPREFKSAAAASQVRDSPYRFTRVSPLSSRVWLAMGYAVIDNPAMPIVGEGDAKPNDTYVEQLVSSARAAVDEVVRRGVVDRDRIAIGGHSYGAFMTANLLAHSDLFAAGIARSGAYNRTLTPFGFQAEERSFWEAPEVYFAMSPFMHADKVKEPILLIHGQADNNSGTFPIQSERYYSALKGHGANVRLVMLPHESHGYRARESILHALWETERWLDRYVRDRQEPVSPESD